MYPVNWYYCVNQFLKSEYENHKKLIREFQPLIILVNSLYKELENKNIKETINGNYPLNYFLNKSYQIKK